MRTTVGLAAYRRWSQVATVASVGLVVGGLFWATQGGPIYAAVALAAMGTAILLASTRLKVSGDPEAARQLILIGKQNCALCDEAKARLAPLASQHGFQVREARIEDDQRLAGEFANWVPVIMWQHQTLARGQIDWDALDRALKARAPGPQE